MTISIEYKPEDVIGEWGWIWRKGDWAMVLTIEDENDDGLVALIYDPHPTENDPELMFTYLCPEVLRGKPYLPLLRPGAPPNAGLLAALYVGDGAAAQVSVSGDEKSKAMREAVMAALLPEAR